MATAPALAVAAIVPLGDAVWDYVRTRRTGAIAVLISASLLIGAALTLFTGRSAFALVQGSLVTGTIGIVFLVSLATARPAIFALARQYSTGGDAASSAAWDARWNEEPRFREGMRYLTLIWGAGLLSEALVRAALVAVLPAATAALFSPLLDAATIVALIAYTGAFARRAARRAETGRNP